MLFYVAHIFNLILLIYIKNPVLIVRFFQKIRSCCFNNFPIFLLQYKAPVFFAGLVSIFGLCYQGCLLFKQDTHDSFACSLCLFPFKNIVMVAGIPYVCFMVKNTCFAGSKHPRLFQGYDYVIKKIA